jgi:hypothetical protein
MTNLSKYAGETLVDGSVEFGDVDWSDRFSPGDRVRLTIADDEGEFLTGVFLSQDAGLAVLRLDDGRETACGMRCLVEAQS